MRQIFSLVVFCCLGCAVDSVHADKLAAPASVSKQSLPTRMDVTTAARLDAALQRMQVGQEKLNMIQIEIAPASRLINEVQKKYSIKLLDEHGRPYDVVDFQTGEIARAAPAALPSESSHDKAAATMPLPPPAPLAAEAPKTAKK